LRKNKLVSKIIWKKSVSDNKYICNICGSELINNGKLTGAESPNSPLYEKGVLCCKKCHHVVAKEIA
jgi:hypothetical protein